ncbi:MAG: toll/interleukin-1 receptor domain-containing protein, partial [Clostridia bacterium]|nr:toll/interleukin-1 receptor domain-containing protein [Clostridia bacterium]
KEWEEEIADKLLGCSVLLFLVSERSLESTNCKDELHLARAEGKKFVNVLVENISDMPSWFKLRYMRYQDCRLFNYDSYDEAVETLSQKVGEMAFARSSGGKSEAKKPSEEIIQQHASYPEDILQKPEIDAEKYDRSIRNNKFEKGSVVEFGSYPQTADGKVKPIEWLVLESYGSKAMLLRKYALDNKPYHEKRRSITW